eukprot:TRINITY_DN1930_c0_g2_i3.p3 TRINITY_DN1930_c0_g2~~TRINITY_DN1930_c0_g2_i3.p3  ORF type:complete len:117 (+),score=23.71 TRINITY_DN1930_c0_g2_i3:217-567(+)
MQGQTPSKQHNTVHPRRGGRDDGGGDDHDVPLSFRTQVAQELQPELEHNLVGNLVGNLVEGPLEVPVDNNQYLARTVRDDDGDRDDGETCLLQDRTIQFLPYSALIPLLPIPYFSE